jgi:hypothetical protein
MAAPDPGVLGSGGLRERCGGSASRRGLAGIRVRVNGALSFTSHLCTMVYLAVDSHLQ